MRVIFLDIDGVLINRASFRLPRPHGHATAFPSCVEALNAIIAATDARIVVSSVWRIGTSIADLREIINLHFGVKGKVIAKTPRLTVKKLFEGLPGQIEISAERGDEIDYWLRSDHREPVESYVILDDDNDMRMHKHRLIQTQFETGLTMKDAERAIAMLLKPAAASAAPTSGGVRL